MNYAISTRNSIQAGKGRFFLVTLVTCTLIAAVISVPTGAASYGSSEVAGQQGALPLTDPVEVLNADGNYFLKVNLRDSRVHMRTALANNDSGGLQSLANIKTRFEGQGYMHWAIVNADLFSGNCPGGVNCGQGLTYIDGNRKDNWSAYGTTWPVRGNIGFDSSRNPQISVGDGQSKRHMTVAGGPRTLMGGGNPTCNGQYDSGTGKTYFPDSGEYFDGDVRSWCTDTRPITMVGHSPDGAYLYIGISQGGKTVTQLTQWLKDRGAHETLRFDSGGSTGMYFDGQFLGGSTSRAIADALAVTVDNGPDPATPTPGPSPCSPGSDQVTLFADTGYGGNCVTLGIGDYSNPGNFGNVGNDNAESIKVGSGVQAVLYMDSDYQGQSETFLGDDDNLGNNPIGANSVSSMKVQGRQCNPGADQIALFANTGYSGSCVVLGVGDYPNPGTLGVVGNDNAESIKVGSNVQGILYEHDSYQGRSETFLSDDDNLNDNNIGGNAVSSAKVQPRPPAATPTSPPQPTATAVACTLQFSDVPPDSTFYRYVRCLACRGVLSGYEDGTFRPNNLVTRGQLSKIVSNAVGYGDDPGPQLYEDVSPGNPFYQWVQRLGNHGVIGGYPCDTAPSEPCIAPANRPYFRPTAGATRGQTAKIVSNAAGFNEPPGAQLFEDVPSGSAFFDWVQRLGSRGYMGGYPCGGAWEPCGGGTLPYFRPGNSATRGQVSKIVANTFFPGCDTP